MNIIINQLQKNFGPKVAVDIENYSIQSGDMWGLVGNNGAGKTTLFRLMLDLLKADGGSVHIGNIDVSRSEEWKNITGAFIDEGFMIDYLTPVSYTHLDQCNFCSLSVTGIYLFLLYGGRRPKYFG